MDTTLSVAMIRDDVQHAIDVDGLGQVGGRADLVGQLFVQSGDDHDRQIPQSRLGVQRLAELPPVHHRHHQIEENHARPRALVKERHRFTAVAGEHDVVPRQLERERHHLPDVVVVLDQQNRSHSRSN